MKKNPLTCLRAGMLLALAGAFSWQAHADYSFRIKNTLGFNRPSEVVEVTIPTEITLSGMALEDETGAPVAYEATANGTILFQAIVPQGKTVKYTLRSGSPAAPQKATYAAIKAPGSRDDIAWENDLTAYRMYSQTLLKAEANTGNGVDLWQKKMSQPVIDDMYNQSNYHTESAYGVDAYSVNGRRLGAGGVSHIEDGKIVVHDPHNTCEVLENGLLRSSFRLIYNNVVVNGASYTKTVTIETYAGSLLNKATVKYEGPAATFKVGCALYLHSDMSGDYRTVTYENVPGLIGLAEQPSEGSVSSPSPRFYLGAYIPGRETETAKLNDHLVVMTDYEAGTELTYYFGGGWNAFPVDAYATDDDWFDALNRFKKSVDSPLSLTSATTIPNREDVISLLHNVNRHWIDTHQTMDSHFWDKAVYHTGNMAAYYATGEEDYREYSERWATHNNWIGATGTDKSKWKYSYGEGGDYVLFGDNQICFQIYIDLYNCDEVKDPTKIARALEVMEYQMSTSNIDYWWWVDGLYMVMPVMTKLYNVTGNQLYLDKMYEYWKYATDLMWDTEEHLYYRDGGYVYPTWYITVGDDPTHKKDFWARGAGWIFAAFARVLDELPATDAHRDEYIQYYKDMAQALKAAQQPEGHWTRSILEPNYATGYETSGTALFTFGYLWGINNGIFSDLEYGDVVEKAWNYLTTIAIQDNYDVGYVQPIGSKAEPGVVISAGQTANFGTGAFLLAASEMIKYAAGDADINALRLSTAKFDGANRIVLTFNEKPDQAEVCKAEHYLLDGKAVNADITTDGNRTVTITFAEPLAYGRYAFEAVGLASEAGGELAKDQTRTLVLTVPLTESPAFVTVTASGNQAGNPAANAIDNNMGTRWSHDGLGQWICLNLATPKKVTAVDIAFYSGAVRKSFFNIEYSADGTTFTPILSGQESSGLTDDLERYYLPQAVTAQYIRIVCNGNSQGGANWNSITELRAVMEIEDTGYGEVVGLPDEIYYDILMPTTTTEGYPISWISSNSQLISENGLVSNPATATEVKLTPYVNGTALDAIAVKVMPRTPAKALRLHYEFEPTDVYDKDGTTYVKDLSAKACDAKVMGSAKIDGKLNLCDNTAAGFSTNGYLLVPEGVLDSIRSYTVFFEIEPTTLGTQPRIYDFGSGAYNSMFFRLKDAAAGFKYNAGTTVLVNLPNQLTTALKQQVAVTFDAATLTTTVYVDGAKAVESKAITTEPYLLTRIAADKRNYIGRTNWWDSSVAKDNIDYQGSIDNFRLYAIALTADEIAAIGSEEDGISAAVANAIKVSRRALSVGETVVVNGMAEASAVDVISVNGATVAHSIANGTAQWTATAPGVYFLRVSSANAAACFKILVK